jgi:uncharacterized membrane protein YfcA
VSTAVFLVLAGCGAGLTGSMAGLASLISYPALLGVGLAPVEASVTNSVALVGSLLGSMGASVPELRGVRRDAVRLAGFGAAGAIAGCALLLLAPPAVFKAVVPWLIAAGSLAILVRPRRAARDTPGFAPAVEFPVAFAIGVYSGYFGAGAGVMLLALLAQRFAQLPVANAVKNMVLGAANVVSCVVFSVAAPVRWSAAAFLGLGFVVGGSLGPHVVRRVNPTLLRIAIAAVGLALAVGLLVAG